MSPSKENCLKALALLNEGKFDQGQWQFVKDFLASAAKRLPTEASLAKDKLRKRTKVKAS